MSLKAELLIDAHALVGEGPIWDADANVLWWVDIMSSELYAYDPQMGENRAWNVGEHVGTVVQRASGGLVLALQDGFAAFDPASGKMASLGEPEAHLPGNRFNDGKCDPGGRFWAGSMSYSDQSDQGSVYRLDTDHSVHKMIENIGISNGIIWSLDAKTMYYTDSLDYAIRAYDYDVETGGISNERVIIDFPHEMGIADGFTIDEEGMLWVAHYGVQPCAPLESGHGRGAGGDRTSDGQCHGVRVRRPQPGSALHHQRLVPNERRGKGATATRGRAVRGASGCTRPKGGQVRRLSFASSATILRVQEPYCREDCR